MLIGGTVLFTSIHGLNQYQVQRFLSCSSLKSCYWWVLFVCLLVFLFCFVFFFFFFSNFPSNKKDKQTTKQTNSLSLRSFPLFCLWSMNGIIRTFSDSNGIFLWHESEDIGLNIKTAYFKNFSWFQFCVYKFCMINYVVLHCSIEYGKSKSRQLDFLWKLLSFHSEMISA